MSKILAKLGRKTLSLALIFNSIISLVSLASILDVFHLNVNGWWPCSSYLVAVLLFWPVIVTAVLNILPAKFIGKVDIERILFHHYVYGLLASSISLTLMIIFAPTYIFVLLMPFLGFHTTGLQKIMIYSGLFFVYGGLTLMIDDIHDVSLRLGRALDRLRLRAYKSGRTLQRVHFISSLATVCTAVFIGAWFLETGVLETGSLWSVSKMFPATSLLITGLWGLKAVKANYWFTNLCSDLSRLESSLRKK